jgi:hypothetical protein
VRLDVSAYERLRNDVLLLLFSLQLLDKMLHSRTTILRWLNVVLQEISCDGFAVVLPKHVHPNDSCDYDQLIEGVVYATSSHSKSKRNLTIRMIRHDRHRSMCWIETHGK